MLFAVKIAAGCAYGWFYSLPGNIETSDTWRYFNLSKPETNLLLKDPALFIKDLFSYSTASSGNLFLAHQSYWNNLKDNILIKILAVINVFSFKNYYTAVIFFNFFFFFGCIAFYRLMKEKIKANVLVLVTFIFFIPSFLFWCSGVHKDGFVFMSVTLLAFYFNECIQRKKLFAEAIIIFVLCSFLLFAMRNFVLFLLMPALLTWYLCNRYPKKQLTIIAGIYGLSVILFFVSGFITHSIDFPLYIVAKQNEFKFLGGNTQLILPVLEPGLISFIKFLPYAIDIAFFRPHITETAKFLYWPSIAENMFIYILIVYCVLNNLKNKKRTPLSSSSKAFIIFCFVFAVSNLLIMGYTVTLTGAIVRYKGFVLPFLIAPLSYFIQRGKFINEM